MMPVAAYGYILAKRDKNERRVPHMARYGQRIAYIVRATESNNAPYTSLPV